MKKYRIIKQIEYRMPYTLGEFDTFHKCYMFFLKVIKREEENVKNLSSSGYYVVNDFFENKYNLTKFSTKIKIEKKRGKYWYTLRLQDI